MRGGMRLVMHSCPECGQACDCDGEDIELESSEDDCVHECDTEEDDDE